MTWIIRALNLTAVIAGSLALLAWLGERQRVTMDNARTLTSDTPNHSGAIIGGCVAILCIAAATTLAWRDGTRHT